MPTTHFIRFGRLGHIGRFSPVEPVEFARGTRVVCRTPRGLEVGEILRSTGDWAATHDGQILRRLTVEDELLVARLARHQRAAFDACSQLLAERRLDAVLLDVEHLFDGQSLYFYFLGEPPPELDALTAELATTYETQVQFRKFAEAVVNGCGPDCGTEAATGCGQGGCSTCALATACHPHN